MLHETFSLTANSDAGTNETVTVSNADTNNFTQERNFTMSKELIIVDTIVPTPSDEQSNAGSVTALPEQAVESETSLRNPLPPLPPPAQELEYHEFANLFPEMPDEDYNRLADSIAKHGQLEAIVRHEGKILDGRHRYTICRASGIPMKTIDFADIGYAGSPLDFVVDKNLNRRHLTTSQRSMLAEKVATIQHGGDRKSVKIKTGNPALISQQDVARQFKVSEDSIQQARKVRTNGEPEVVKAVEAGKLSVNAAAVLVDAPPETQREIVAKGDKKAVADEVRKLKEDSKQKPQRKGKPVTVKPPKAKQNGTEQVDEQASADDVPSEWMEAARNTWWRILSYGRRTRQDEMSEAIADAIDSVQSAIDADANVLRNLLKNLQGVQALVKAGGTELTAEKIDAVFAAREMLHEIADCLSDRTINELETWSSLQKGDDDWAPFDIFPSYRKGELTEMDVIIAVTHVLASGGWSTERITEALITITGNDKTPNGVAMGDVIASNVEQRTKPKWRDSRVKGFREVTKWLVDCKGIDEFISDAIEDKVPVSTSLKRDNPYPFGIRIGRADDGSYEAKGRLINCDSQFMVLAGSTISRIETTSMLDEVRTKREGLESFGYIKDFTFVQDYPFNTPTKAACFIVGTRVQGCGFWKSSETVEEPATPEQTDSGIDADDATEEAVLTSGGKRITGNVPQTVTLTPPSRM